MKQRIILTTDSQEPSGLGEHMLTLGVGLADQYDIMLAMPDHAAGQALLQRAARLGLRIKALEPGAPRALRAWFQTLPGALLHVHAGIGWEGHDLVRCGKAAGLKVVRTEHLPYLLTSPVQQAEYRAMIRNVDARIAVSQAVFDSHLDRGGAAPRIIRNGIMAPQAAMNRVAVRKALGLAETDPMLLTVARFTAQKGHLVLLEAAPAVIERFPGVKFVLVGSGPDTDGVEQQIAQQGLAKHFMLLGQRADVPDLLAAADSFVLPSLFEGLPLALLEAMAAKVPVVATAIGGSVEALGAEHPFLPPSNDAAALARAITAALDDKDMAQAAAAAAHDRFSLAFSAQRMAAETSALYQSILPERGTTGIPA